jgi:hypothetical protein
VRLASAERLAPIAALAAGADGSLVAVGMAGAVRLPATAAQAAHEGGAR